MAKTKTDRRRRRARLMGLYWTSFAVGFIAIWAGRVVSNDVLMFAGSAILIWAFYMLAARYRTSRTINVNSKSIEQDWQPSETDEPPDPHPVAACHRAKAEGIDDYDALIEQMLDQGRYVLLLRPQIAHGLKREQFDRILQALDEGMALVPDGEVVLGSVDGAQQDDQDTFEQDDLQIELSSRTIRVQRFFLDRYPVTNRQYYEFVAAGGYEQVQLWDETVWPAMLDFVDRTGRPGPRYWRDGCYCKGQENQPVVGVSWYEALAYAGWAGKRLPSDAEWVKAGCWPVTISKTSRFQRRYPWGDTMDRTRANLWGSGPERIVDVSEFAQGVSVGGVYQLIGNVWEWTNDDFLPAKVLQEDLSLEVALKSIHGGAFDTYFDNQATCQFQSGETALARRHNIGFRLAIGVCDLALTPPVSREPVEAEKAEVETISAKTADTDQSVEEEVNV